MAKGDLKVEVNDHGIKMLAKAIKAEADGKQLRKDLVASLTRAVAPGVLAVQGKLRSMPHRSAAHASPALGTYVASKVKAQVKLGGRAPGVAVRIPMTPQIRGFKLAARRLDRKHWRHRVFGRDVWVTQISPIPNFVEETLIRDKSKYRAAVVAAMDDMRDRLARRKYE